MQNWFLTIFLEFLTLFFISLQFYWNLNLRKSEKNSPVKFWFWISSICRTGCFNFGIGIVNGIFNNFIRILPQVWFGNVNGRLIGRIDIYGSIKKKPEVGYIIVFSMENSWNQSTILNEKKNRETGSQLWLCIFHE